MGKPKKQPSQTADKVIKLVEATDELLKTVKAGALAVAAAALEVKQEFGGKKGDSKKNG